MPTDLDALAALAREATAGPWFRPIANDTAIRSDDVDIAQTVGAYELEWERMEADAAYIAAANPAVVLGLIERVQRAEAKLEAIRDDLTELIAAAEECAEDLDGHISDRWPYADRSPEPPIIRQTVRRLRAAVARVRGE